MKTKSKILSSRLILGIFLIALAILAVLIFVKEDFKSPEVITISEKTDSLKFVTIEEFVLDVSKKADSWNLKKKSRPLFVLDEGYEILEKEEAGNPGGALVKNFPEFWEYHNLKPYVEDFELTVMLVCSGGSQLLIYNLEEFLNIYSPDDGKFRVWPKPKYIVSYGNKIFLIGYDGKIWRTRRQSEHERKMIREEKVINLNRELYPK